MSQIILCVIVCIGITATGCVSNRVPLDRYAVPLVRIICSPEAFNDQPVLITGYLVYESGNKAVYPTKEYADAGLIQSSVLIKPAEKPLISRDDREMSIENCLSACNKQYVTIRGVFRTDKTGVINLSTGTLVVDEASLWLTENEYKNKMQSEQGDGD